MRWRRHPHPRPHTPTIRRRCRRCCRRRRRRGRCCSCSRGANTSTTSIAGCHSPSRGRLSGRAATRNQNRQSRLDNRPAVTGRPSQRWRIRLARRWFPRVTSNGQTPHFWKRTTSTTLATTRARMRATTLAPSPAGAMRLDQGAAFRCQISASRVCSPGRGSASRTAARMLARPSRLWGR